MAMLNGEGYLKSIRDGRRSYLEGKRIDDVTTDQRLAAMARHIARGYDKGYSPDPSARRELVVVPKSIEDLRRQADMFGENDWSFNSTGQGLLALLTASRLLGRANEAYATRIRRYIAECIANDWRTALGITDAKGDRALSAMKQEDPDLYVHVVDRNAEGVFITGAKMHVSMAAMVHEICVMPTKRMKPGEEAYSIACGVPLNAPGVTIINSSAAPKGEDIRHFPYSSQHGVLPDALVVFDRVFVPNDRIFLDGEVDLSAVVAHSLGLWERLGSLAHNVSEADLMVGVAHLMAEANGIDRIPHIKEKIGDIVLYATMMRAGVDAAVARAQFSDDGMCYPNELYTNAAKFYSAANYHKAAQNLQEIAGGAVVTAPTMADLDNPETGPLVRKYMRGRVPAEQRLKLLHLIRDMTADAYGGWQMIAHMHAAGGLFAQRVVTKNHYDMKTAVEMAREAAGL